jgi:hypothetical protein
MRYPSQDLLNKSWSEELNVIFHLDSNQNQIEKWGDCSLEIPKRKV